jgi:hypothetical protein
MLTETNCHDGTIPDILIDFFFNLPNLPCHTMLHSTSNRNEYLKFSWWVKHYHSYVIFLILKN